MRSARAACSAELLRHPRPSFCATHFAAEPLCSEAADAAVEVHLFAALFVKQVLQLPGSEQEPGPGTKFNSGLVLK